MPCEGWRTTPLLRALTAHRARMSTWTDRKTTPAKDHGVAELEGPKDAGIASHALRKLRLDNGNRHSRSRHRSGQPQRSHREEGALPHGAMRNGAQPRPPHAAKPACRPAHSHRRGSEHLWMLATRARPRAMDVTQLPAQQEMTLSRPRRQDAYRQLLQEQQPLPRHLGRWQPASLRKHP